jgi:hypothetical protein
MKVRILTKLLTKSTEESSIAEGEMSQKTIEWNDSSDRKWLMNHFHWAMMNNHAVLIRPIF